MIIRLNDHKDNGSSIISAGKRSVVNAGCPVMWRSDGYGRDATLALRHTVLYTSEKVPDICVVDVIDELRGKVADT
jgi:hypothetical protein